MKFKKGDIVFGVAFVPDIYSMMGPFEVVQVQTNEDSEFATEHYILKGIETHAWNNSVCLGPKRVFATEEEASESADQLNKQKGVKYS